MAKIRILVASEYPMIRDALHQPLETAPDFNVFGETDISGGLQQSFESYSPDLVTIEMPSLNALGLRAVGAFMKSNPSAAVVVLTENANAICVRSIMATGVLGYVLKAAGRPFVNQPHRISVPVLPTVMRSPS